ncbi:MAG: glycerol-3-phosphate 1-O-acyltransferase PlsY [bacterium]
MKIVISILCLIMSYLYGSVPFALVIGKVFYHTDVRTQGSHNLGGTNAGRVLGKKAGLIVIILDATKCIIAIALTRLIANYAQINTDLTYLSAIACVIGHCYPIFAQFKGGKAVSSALAYLLMTNLYGFLIAFVVFMTTLKLSKYVSLSSILGCVAVCLASPWICHSTMNMIANFIISAIIIYRHKENIKRLLNGTESKITWM